MIGHLLSVCKDQDPSTGIFFLTFRIVLASARGSSCTKMQAPLDQAEKRVQAAFTQPVSVVFQKMSDSVKAIHLLPKKKKMRGSKSILINVSTFRMDFIIHVALFGVQTTGGTTQTCQIDTRSISSTTISTNTHSTLSLHLVLG